MSFTASFLFVLLVFVELTCEDGCEDECDDGNKGFCFDS